ncbi:MAG: 4Fe-4S binding protein [Phycisphaerales bacterium]|nr:4Fe-4S binding protein [Phycisphaerales bacterium]
MRATPIHPAPAPADRPRSFGRRRAGCLIAVHLLIAAHIVHWRLAGRTLAPLELNEVVYTLELGILTAGFVFMVLITLSVLLFGRFFCSWGCHILALQDLCAWLLEKVHIRPKPVRSRAMLLTPLGVMGLMFLWPTAQRLLAGEPLPTWRVMRPEDPWGSFVTDDFWRNLPGPWIAGLTFLICGFVIVYALGSRSFCRYGCPYGAVFGLMDRLAPGRIVARGDCSQCGACTAACQSHIRVHSELTVFGRVVDPQCLKDLDCVAACPEGAIGYGIAAPALFASWKRGAVRRPRADYSWGEELAIAAIIVLGVLIFRGLYDALPLLLSVALATLLAWIALTTWRVIGGVPVRAVRLTLARQGAVTLAGWGWLTGAFMVLLLTLHSASMRLHEVALNRAYDATEQALARGDEPAAERHAATGVGHALALHRWGLIRPDGLLLRTASLLEWTPHPRLAEPFLRELIDRGAHEPEARLRLAALLARDRRSAQAIEQLELARRLIPAMPRETGERYQQRLDQVAAMIADTPEYSPGGGAG